jgi:hypothetical protein
MTSLVIAVPHDPERKPSHDQRMQVVVNVQAEVIDSVAARRHANIWLLEHVGNLLHASGAELLLAERLLWRFDVVLGVPSLEQEGHAQLHHVGRIVLDAVSGEVEDAAALADELMLYAAQRDR